MRKILIVLSLLALTSCSNVRNAWEAATTSTVSPTVVIVAANSFDALEVTATNYLKLPKCTSATNVCRSPEATAKIIPAIRAGRVARNNLEQFMRDHPGQLGSQGSYDALKAAINTLNDIFATYSIK